MDFKIIVAVLLIVGGVAGYSYGVNMQHVDNEEEELYSSDKSLVVNESSRNGELEFDNNTLGIWYQEDEFFLDMDGDDSFESELSENETATGDFVREVVRGDKAYQVYFRYDGGSENSSASLEVYRVRRI